MDLFINELPFIRCYAEFLFLDAIINNQNTNNERIAAVTIQNYDSLEWKTYFRNATYTIEDNTVHFIREHFDIDSSKSFFRSLNLRHDECVFCIQYQQYTNGWDCILFYADSNNTKERIDNYPAMDFVVGRYCNGNIFLMVKGEYIWIGNPTGNSYSFFKISLSEFELTLDVSNDGKEWNTLFQDVLFSPNASVTLGCTICLLDNQYYKYLCNNFISITFNPTYQSRINYTDFIKRNTKTYGVHPFVKFSYDTNQTIFKWYGSLWNYITDKIQNKIYLQFILNERYIPGSESYQKTDYLHENLVFGYDEAEMSYHILHILKGKPVILTVHESDMKAALTDNEIIGLSYQPNHNAYLLDIPHIRDRIEDYLSGINVSLRHGYISEIEEGKFGIHVYDSMFENGDGREVFLNDLRVSYLLYEHKKCMQLRFAYLYEWGLIPKHDYDMIAADMQLIVALAERIMLMVIKNQCVPSEKCRKKIDDNLMLVKNTEIRCYSHFLGVCDLI